MKFLELQKTVGKAFAFVDACGRHALDDEIKGLMTLADWVRVTEIVEENSQAYKEAWQGIQQDCNSFSDWREVYSEALPESKVESVAFNVMMRSVIKLEDCCFIYNSLSPTDVRRSLVAQKISGWVHSLEDVQEIRESIKLMGKDLAAVLLEKIRALSV